MKLSDIPVVVESGQKFVTEHGVTAIKNGIKRKKTEEDQSLLRKPSWLKVKAPGSKKYQELKTLVRQKKLSTVCEEAMCPNIGECWEAGTATIMLMGAVCTRACKFCAVDTGNPKGWRDQQEPNPRAMQLKLWD